MLTTLKNKMNIHTQRIMTSSDIFLNFWKFSTTSREIKNQDKITLFPPKENTEKAVKGREKTNKYIKKLFTLSNNISKINLYIYQWSFYE